MHLIHTPSTWYVRVLSMTTALTTQRLKTGIPQLLRTVCNDFNKGTNRRDRKHSRNDFTIGGEGNRSNYNRNNPDNTFRVADGKGEIGKSG